MQSEGKRPELLICRLEVQVLHAAGEVLGESLSFIT